VFFDLRATNGDISELRVHGRLQVHIGPSEVNSFAGPHGCFKHQDRDIQSAPYPKHPLAP
jgi:hypothetical protein